MRRQRRSLNKKVYYKRNNYANKKVREEHNDDIFEVIDQLATKDFSKNEVIIEDEEEIISDNKVPIKKNDTYVDEEDISYEKHYDYNDPNINILNLDKNEEVEDNSKEDNNDRIIIDISSKKHVSFKTRIITLSILILICLISAILLFGYSLRLNDNKEVTFDSRGFSDYRLYLRENGTGLEYLDKDDLRKSNRAYLMNLVDKLDVNFTYDFDINQKSNIDFRYRVMAEIVIKDLNNKEIYSDRSPLSSLKVIKMNDTKTSIKEEVKDIDYIYYQSIADSYSSQLGEETNNYLNIYLDVKKENSDKEKNILLDDEDKVLVTIPLTDDVLMSSITYTNVLRDNQKVSRVGFLNTKRDIACIALVFVVLAIYFALHLYNLLSLLRDKKSIYDKYIERLLRKYNKCIAESETIVNLKKYNVIKIKNFDELLDVYYNLGLPIIYCEVVKGQKSYFYIKNNKDIYLLQIKAVDLEKKETI